MKHSQNNPSERFDKNDIHKLLSEDSIFAVKEAYGTIRTKLMFTGKGEKCPVYAVTSSMPNDGKTMTSVNLAISFAQMGKKILLIDADMRKPTIHRYLSLQPKFGLSEVLAELSETLSIKKTSIENLHVITAGEIPPNPSELLASSRVDFVLERVRENFDYVFIDTTPVEVVTDATLLASKITGYVFIVQCGKSEITNAKHSIETLRALGATISGFIMNDSKGKGGRPYYKGKYNYKYKYNYSGYGPDSTDYGS